MSQPHNKFNYNSLLALNKLRYSSFYIVHTVVSRRGAMAAMLHR